MSSSGCPRLRSPLVLPTRPRPPATSRTSSRSASGSEVLSATREHRRRRTDPDRAGVRELRHLHLHGNEHQRQQRGDRCEHARRAVHRGAACSGAPRIRDPKGGARGTARSHRPGRGQRVASRRVRTRTRASDLVDRTHVHGRIDDRRRGGAAVGAVRADPGTHDDPGGRRRTADRSRGGIPGGLSRHRYSRRG